MITATIATAASAFAARLARRAGAIATARTEERLRQQSAAPSRWRDPRLLWPLFTKG